MTMATTTKKPDPAQPSAEPRQRIVMPPKIIEATFGIVGLAPGYIGNGFSDSAKAQLPPNPKTKKTEAAMREKPDFKKISQEQRQLLAPPRNDATDGIKASAFKQAIVRAAKGVAGIDMIDVRTMIFVIGGPDGLVPIRSAEPREFSRTGNLGGKKGSACIITQPFYAAPWSAILTMQFDETFLPTDDVLALVERAGSLIGVGAWRPECNGEYGRFQIDKTVGLEEREL